MKMPWWAPVVLCVAVLAVSSAGAVMKSVVAAAPVALASWRLQATSILLLPLFAFQLWRCSDDVRSRLFSPMVVLTLVLSGFCLAAHFGLWVYSLTATSLPHSLLFVSTPPLILACVSIARGMPLARLEIVGLLLGVAGVILVSLSVVSEKEVTLLGDAAAFGGAVAFAVYVLIAKDLRSWLPLFLFAFPVTAVAAMALALVSVSQSAVEHYSSSGVITAIHAAYGGSHATLEPHSVYNPFAWVDRQFLLPVVYLAVGPGFLGHTGLNAVLRYMTPLTIAMAITSEPPLGTLLGWLIGQTAAPGVLTCIGGAVLVLAVVVVAYAEESRPPQEDSKDAAAGDVALQPMLKEPLTGVEGEVRVSGRPDVEEDMKKRTRHWEDGDDC